MKNLALLILVLTLFTSCNEKKPKYWLSQIKNEKAKKRTIDVLEKIYISTAYSVLEKDSLSKFHTKLANCQLPDSIEHSNWILRYLDGYKNNKVPSDRHNALMKYIFDLYQKDYLVDKAALSSLIDTTKIDFGRYFPSYYSKQNHFISNSKKPSENLISIEEKLLKYVNLLNYGFTREETDYIEKIEILLKEALQDSTSFDYGLPRIAEHLNLLISTDKKFLIYSFSFQKGSNSNSIDAYANYRDNSKDKIITEYISNFTFDDNDSYGESAIPLALFQVEKNKKPLYIIISDHDGGGMDGSNVVVKAYQIEDNKIKLCKDCIEGKSTGVFQKSPHYAWVVPAFDSTKNEITFNYRKFYGNVKSINSEERNEIRKKKTGSGEIMERMTLKWNGQQLVSIPLKLYCEE